MLALGWLAGCGGGDPVATYPVEGEVRLDGNPVGDRIVGASVLFEPTATAENGKAYSARGLIDKNGHYHLTTFSPGDGAMVGRHRVAVVVPSSVSGAREHLSQQVAPPPRLVPIRYASLNTSGLEVEVLPQANQLDLDLQSSP